MHRRPDTVPVAQVYIIAHTQLIRWIVAETDLSLMDTYQLVTQASRSPIANVCDANYSAVVKVRKSLLPASRAYGGVHDDLRRRAAELR